MGFTHRMGNGKCHGNRNCGGAVQDAEVRYVFKTGFGCFCGRNYRFIKKGETDSWKQMGGARDLVDQSLTEAVGTLRENANTVIKERRTSCCDNGVDYDAASEVLN